MKEGMEEKEEGEKKQSEKEKWKEEIGRRINVLILINLTQVRMKW